MLIQDFRASDRDEVRSFMATMSWEQADRSPFDMEFTVEATRGGRLADLNPDAFMIPGSIVAMRDGEARVSGGGPICPALYNGLSCSLQWLARWAKFNLSPPTIDFEIGCKHPLPTNPRSVGLISGGVDSLAMLAANHRNYPPGHPLRITLGIVVVGIQKYRWKDSASIRERLQAARHDMADLSRIAGIEIIPVATNLRSLVADSSFWKNQYQGAVLAGVSHLFAQRVANVSIASSFRISHLTSWGSHPLIDVGYGTHSLRVWHELAHLGRLEKTRVIAKRPDLLRLMNVCNEPAAGNMNCGSCEKCVRTMLALQAIEVDPTPIFGRSSVEPEDLRRVRYHTAGREDEYEELIEPLRAIGEDGLAEATVSVVRKNRILRKRPVRALLDQVSPIRTRFRGA